VWEPAGLSDTAFLRTDELPGRAARNYLGVDGLRTNVLYLPVLATGDGGAYTTAADLAAFWSALFAGRLLPLERVAQMITPRSDWPAEHKRYGLGFHLHETSDAVWLEGYDAGVSFLSRHEPATGETWTVMSNWSNGAWPIVSLLDTVLHA
jgi:CubicO group peptidase (beta-lactamase class C family)